MTNSMTAFARQETATPWGNLVWELRAVNHRYLEINPRLPEELRGLEPRVRELVGKRLERGKVDCTLRFQSPEAVAVGVDLDLAQAQRVAEAAGRLRQLAPDLVGPMGSTDLLRWPGVLKVAEPDVEALSNAAIELLASALDEFIATRAREGARMRDVILQRLEAATSVAAGVREVVPEAQRLYRERLVARLEDVRQQLDPNRLEQEMVLFASRSDVAEELDRLDAHFAEIRRLLGGRGAIGRRLDFLMQELNREANTLGSKAVDIRMTQAAVELKVLIEQMREQVQNIE